MVTGITECPGGVYIKNSSVSANAVSMALAAFMANTKVTFQVWNDDFWGGSGAQYCKVRAIKLSR